MGIFNVLLKIWRKPVFKRSVLYVAGLVPDKLYVKLTFKGKVGYDLDLENPKTFNEKLNWIKLYNRNPLYTKLADKMTVKSIVADRIGEEYVVKNLGCWKSFDEIDFSSLPSQFVLKCTHDSSGAIICRDKDSFDYAKAKSKIDQTLKMNYYYACREWPYKNIPPRIIADEFLDDGSGRELNDYKFWCFNGKPTYMYCTLKTNKENIYENFYDMDFNPVDINHGFLHHSPEFEKPEVFDLMKDLAAKLSVGIPFVRIDFFYVKGRVYFGEYTFFDWAGLQPFKSYEQDLELGKLIRLPAE